MAVYKVPQDVEADDKLIGPFSFRQFIYLIIVAISIALAWGLSQLFIPLAIIPLPLIIFFGALALPLRKDQPMEVYMAAIVSFYLKPRRRLWIADGVQSLVEITAPKIVEFSRTKDLSQGEAEQRLSYLAQIADTQGWAVRGIASAPVQNTALSDDLYFEAQQTPDVFDTATGVAQAFDTKLAEADSERREKMMRQMQQPAPVAQATIQPISAVAPTIPDQVTPPAPTADDPSVTFNPYPNSMHQSVIQPLDDDQASTPIPPPTDTPVSTSEKQVSPDIISLASNPDLSIETMAHEAQRITDKEAELKDDEVLISLR
ncbi:MAG: uncharacterized protein JWM00_132 [Candidatus Saccharibacteria bacterium]|nr:uncharacterized protein [Candidatus Saccharibacteria bacterium]